MQCHAIVLDMTGTAYTPAIPDTLKERKTKEHKYQLLILREVMFRLQELGFWADKTRFNRRDSRKHR